MQHLQSVQEIFQDKLFKIPDYQRGYAWEDKQWQDLLDDLELMEENQEHYTGTLVIHAPDANREMYDDDGNVFKLFDVVDGQQRMTTLSILMNELANEFMQFNTKGKQLAKGIRKKYIASVKDGEKLPKLALNRDTNEFYKKNIIAEKASVAGATILSEQRLLAAKAYFSKFFQAKQTEHNENYLPWLERFYAKISSKMKLTVYEVPQATDVGIIFEGMNNRGKTLTEMEKVKNYLLYIASKLTCSGGKELGESINQTWTYIFESLMSASGSDENQLLRNHWLMSMDYNPKKWEGCNSVKAKFNLKIFKGKHDQLRDEVRSYASLLKECCTAYCDIINPKRGGAFSRLVGQDGEKNKIINETVKILRIGSVASFVPVLIAVRIKYPDNHSVYRDYLELCEKFAFRVYRFAEKRSNTGQTTLFRFGHELYKGTSTLQETYDKIRSLLLYYAPNEDFEADTKKVDDWYNSWYGLKYLLYEYETFCAGNKPVKMEWSSLQKLDKQDSIEHILPQTPDKPYWKNRWTKSQIKSATHDFGNLVLTLDNSVYSNHGFDVKKGKPDKKGCYANSCLFSERELTQYSEWTYQSFLQRRERIEKWILQRWSVDSGKLLDIKPEEDVDSDDISDEVKESL